MAGTKGRSGRKKTPAAIKKRDGTFRPDRDADSIQPPAATLPPKPDGLHKKAQQEWDRLAPICHSLGLLTESDWMAWQLGFSAFSTWLFATDKLASGDWTTTTDTGYRQAVPEMAILKQAQGSVLAFCREFGLTPSARASLDIQTPGQSKPDSMESLLN